MTTSITWHGHANFQIETTANAGTGLNILIDPFFTGNPKATCKWEDIKRPDLVLVTHMHGDHFGDCVAICNHHQVKLGGVVGLVEALVERGLDKQLVINGIGFNIGGTICHQGAQVTMTEAFHTSEAGTPVGYIITLPDGFTIYHAGDTGIFRNMKTWGELYSIDLALLPAGGTFTMDARQAALAAQFLKAKAAIPMHFGTFPALAQSCAEFERELAAKAPKCRPILMQPGQSMAL